MDQKGKVFLSHLWWDEGDLNCRSQPRLIAAVTRGIDGAASLSP
jgi:hypothetical protein